MEYGKGIRTTGRMKEERGGDQGKKAREKRAGEGSS
jgi:hypothetical protein